MYDANDLEICGFLRFNLHSNGINWLFTLRIKSTLACDFVYGTEKFEVKYRDDWQEIGENYFDDDKTNKSEVTIIIPTDTNLQKPHLKYIGLEKFLS